MSTLHPHWQSTDDGAPVPVRIAPNKVTARSVALPNKTVSRRPAAVVGILLTLSMGAVTYGTLDDGTSPLPADIMDDGNPTTAFDVLSEQMARSSAEQALHAAPTGDAREGAPQQLQPSIPVNPSTFDRRPQALSPSLPINTNTLARGVAGNVPIGTPQPIEQPQTGAGMLWATILGATTILAWQTRGMLKARSE